MAATIVGLALAALAAGGTYVNTQNTARHQDEAQAQAIRNQSRTQKKADARVNDEVNKLQGSRSGDEQANRFGEYIQALRRNRGSVESGLEPTIGSDAFKSDAASAATQTQSYADKTAGLLSRIDAPQLQRQGEAFGYGNLATHLNLLGREAAGQNFLDQLRARNIRRNAKIDLASGLASAGAGAMAGGAGAGAGSTAGYWKNGNSLTGGTYSGPWP